jgi:predicted RNA-binding protein associated with RNAse of E/G family
MVRHEILEIKESLGGKREEYLCELVRQSQSEVVLLYRLSRPWRVEDVLLPAGTLSFGYFWEDRHYNAYHWLTPDGFSMGIYFNISDGTRFTPETVRWRDLEVDVLVTPDDCCRVLDAGELPEDIDPEVARKVELAREEILEGYRSLVAGIVTSSMELFRSITDIT